MVASKFRPALVNSCSGPFVTAGHRAHWEVGHFVGVSIGGACVLTFLCPQGRTLSSPCGWPSCSGHGTGGAASFVVAAPAQTVTWLGGVPVPRAQGGRRWAEQHRARRHRAALGVVPTDTARSLVSLCEPGCLFTPCVSRKSRGTNFEVCFHKCGSSRPAALPEGSG